MILDVKNNCKTNKRFTYVLIYLYTHFFVCLFLVGHSSHRVWDILKLEYWAILRNGHHSLFQGIKEKESDQTQGAYAHLFPFNRYHT